MHFTTQSSSSLIINENDKEPSNSTSRVTRTLYHPPQLSNQTTDDDDDDDYDLKGSRLQEAKYAAVRSSKFMNIPITHIANKNVKSVLKDIVSQLCPQTEPCILMVDLATIAKQFFLFREHLPNVHLHYAVKCFPDRMVIKMLYELGASFDCASAEEIQLVCNLISNNKNENFENRIILANPIKSTDDLKCAQGYGVKLVTLDCVEELHKISKYLSTSSTSTSSIKILLRIATDDKSSGLPLSSKFGIKTKDEVINIFDQANKLNIQIVGVAFHVGSTVQSLDPYNVAFKNTFDIFQIGIHQYNMNMNIIDIGGGFPGSSDIHPGSDGQPKLIFEDITKCIQYNLNHYFQNFEDLQILAEPGRFVACQCATLATRIEKVIQSNPSNNNSTNNNSIHYCIGDGIHGYFRDAWMFDYLFIPNVLLQQHKHQYQQHESSNQELQLCDILGITMEVGDVVARNVQLPKLEKGDWIVFDNMGSYSSCLTTARTDVPHATIVYAFCDENVL